MVIADVVDFLAVLAIVEQVVFQVVRVFQDFRDVLAIVDFQVVLDIQVLLE